MNDHKQLPSAMPATAREWAHQSFDYGRGECFTVSGPALQALLDEVHRLRALAFAVENRIKVTVESSFGDET